MTDHEKDNVQEKKCDKNLSFIDMLLIMMILLVSSNPFTILKES